MSTTHVRPQPSHGARTPWRLGGIALALLFGCTGQVGVTDQAGKEGAPLGPSTNPKGGGGGADVNAVPTACVPVGKGSVRNVPLRRLTRLEYANSVGDLLKVGSVDVEALPPDDALGGYAANATLSVSVADAEAYRASAEALAASLDIGKVLGCDPTAQGERACAAAFIKGFAHRAFRKVASEAQINLLMSLYDEKRARSDFTESAKLMVAIVLQSPAFLYRAEAANAEGRLTDEALASRLSYMLWASAPDTRLMDLAQKEQLHDPKILRMEVQRMIADPRADAVWADFHQQWLGVPKLDNLSKDENLYPEFTPGLKAAMKRESAQFVAAVFRGSAPTLPNLLQARVGFSDNTQRFGLLTLPAWLSVASLPDQPSPIHRGLFLRRRLLCQEVPDPPKGLVVVPPKVDLTQTTKARFDAHRTNPSCASCHALMDPLGFAFQNYDAIGRYRTMEGKFPVDAKGEVTGTSADGAFDGVQGLVAQLLRTEELPECMTRQWLRFARGVAEVDAEDCAIKEISQRFRDGGLNLLDLVAAVAESPLLSFQGESPSAKVSP